MGMTYQQFEDALPYELIAYKKAHRLRLESANEQAWLQGIYFFDAFAVCLANAFSKRGAKRQNYIEKPLDIFPLTESEKKRREKEEIAKAQQAMESMIRRQRQKKTKGD